MLQLYGRAKMNRLPNVRAQQWENLWNKMQENNEKMSLDHYHTYILLCTENEVLLDHQNFLNKMQCEASLETYKLLLENACNLNNLEQAFSILEEMKNKDYSVDERVFNALVLLHTLRK